MPRPSWVAVGSYPLEGAGAAAVAAAADTAASAAAETTKLSTHAPGTEYLVHRFPRRVVAFHHKHDASDPSPGRTLLRNQLPRTSVNRLSMDA
jgi:hypothetical protein